MLHFGATGRWTRPNSWRALESKQGCLDRSRAMQTSHVHVAVGVTVLDRRDPRVGNSVQQVVRASIPQMKNAVGPDAIVDREADPYQRLTQLAGHGIALAAANQDVAGELPGRVLEFQEIDSAQHDSVGREPFDRGAQPPAPSSRAAERGLDSELAQKSGQTDNEIFFAVDQGPRVRQVLVSVDVGIDEPAAFGDVLRGHRAAGAGGKHVEKRIGLADSDGQAEPMAGNGMAIPQSATG